MTEDEKVDLVELVAALHDGMKQMPILDRLPEDPVRRLACIMVAGVFVSGASGKEFAVAGASAARLLQECRSRARARPPKLN